jgi:hypothetical protein
VSYFKRDIIEQEKRKMIVIYECSLLWKKSTIQSKIQLTVTKIHESVKEIESYCSMMYCGQYFVYGKMFKHI